MGNLLQRGRSYQLRRFDFDGGELLSSVVRRLARRRAPRASSTLWVDAAYGWGNVPWAADERYLAEAVRAAETSTGAILECGSGLTTLLLSAVAARRGLPLHSLEHNAGWHARVSSELERHGSATTVLHLVSLRDYGEFEWYDAPLDRMPESFSLVVCDGPPGTTRGGRSGMLPTMRARLDAGCVILLDDANREGEREVVGRWSRERGVTARVDGTRRGLARLVVNARA